MDIRKFFGPVGLGGAKKPASETKPQAPAKAKSTESQQKKKNITKKGASSPSTTLLKNKPSKPLELKDDVEVISDSEEEPVSKKSNPKGSRGGRSTASKDKKADNAKGNKTDQQAVTAKHADSKGPAANGKGKMLKTDIDLESKVAGKGNGSEIRRNKKLLTDSDIDMEGEDESPFQTKKASRSKPRLEEHLDSEEEVVKSAAKKPRKASRRSVMDSDEEVQHKKKTKGHRIIDSDSDAEDPLPKKRPGRKRKKEAVVFVDDSDEDKTPKKGSLDAFVVHMAPKAKTEAETKKQQPEEKKVVSAVDFYGKGTVLRVERNTLSGKRKAAETVDTEFHDDNEFTKTLEQLDKQEAKKARMDVTPVKEKPAKEEGGSSLASKLSQKMKTASPVAASPGKRDTNSNVVPDTPVVQDTPDYRKTPRKGRSSETSLSSPPATNQSKTEVAEGSEKPRPSSAEKKTPPKSAGKEESGKGSANRNWGSYRSFLNREGPRALGSKEIPTGAENCLEGLTFVITGVLESLERDEAKSLVERYGGKVTGSVSNRTRYIVVGRDPGAAKIAKAEQCKTTQLDEDGLLELIRTLPGKKSKYQEQAEQAARKEQSLKKSSSTSSQFTALKKSQSRSQDSAAPDESDTTLAGTGDTDSRPPGKSAGADGSATLMWVDKHRPRSLKQIIGQQGEKSNARKLLTWIQRWHKNRAAGVKPTGRFYGQDDGSGHRAALLSGPPGIGKTTTAIIVCKEAGFSTVELNASDKRSKRSLKEDMAEALGNQTLVDYMGPQSGPVTGHNHCVIMDEVDGMAGNEDRGGLQELVQLIKSTKIPIICICNDRNSMKMRTLANYCFDLRFQRPRLEQIKAALMSIAFKEGLKVSPPALQEIILSSNQDIRQCIHNMSMWTSGNKELSYDQAKEDAKKAQKDVRLGIFDVSRKVFAGGEETARMTIHDKSDLFFQDYSFVPLFVHENYVSVTPFAAKGNRTKHLSLLARTAESICDGDLVDRQVRGNGNWNLLPTQAMYASVIPGEYMRGSVSQMIQFPAWLGRNSTTTKNDRILQELRSHMALQVSCDKRGLNMDYLPALRLRLTEPLAQEGSEGVPRVIQLMDDYDIIKDDYDSILEISKWPNSQDPLAHLDSKTKAAFTRQYNKECHLTPYATGTAPKKKRGRGAAVTEEDYGMEAEEGAPSPVSESEEEEESVELDTMIKTSKKPGKGQASSSKGKAPAKGKAASSKGKGKGQR